MNMPFGQHKGKPLDQIPDGYLEWLLTINLRPPLREAVEREVAYRETQDDDDVDATTGRASLPSPLEPDLESDGHGDAFEDPADQVVKP